MPISPGSIRDELFPGLATIERRIGQPIVAYQAFDRDVLVIRAGENTLEIARSEIEDNRHLAKLRFFLETLMCNKVAGSVGPPPPSDEFYQAMMTAAVKARVLDYNPFLAELKAEVKNTPSKNALPKPAKPTSTPSWPPAPDLILDETN